MSKVKAAHVSLIGAGVIALAAAAGILINVNTQPENVDASPTPTVIVTMARSQSPAPTPTINSIRLYTYGRELDADGFTMYVGDRPVEITAELDPKVMRPKVYWRLSDDQSASLTVSSEGTSCTFNALKPSGKNELTVSCYGAEVTSPVYLWER